MIFEKEIARQVAEYLLKIKAIKLNVNLPFTWASGLQSPIYCDNRIALSYPKIRGYIKRKLTDALNEHFQNTEIIAGVAMAGIPQGILVADTAKLPFAYVRSEKKTHGLGNQIEGFVTAGQKVLVVEDLVSTGKSSLSVVETLRNAGLDVVGILAIFSYGLEVAKANFEKANCPLLTLSDFNILLNMATLLNYISVDDLLPLTVWQMNPAEWSKGARGSESERTRWR